MTRFPNPFNALTDIVAKAFITLGDRDGLGGGRFGLTRSDRSSRPTGARRAPSSEAVDRKQSAYEREDD